MTPGIVDQDRQNAPNTRNTPDIPGLLERQRSFFATGATLDHDFRKDRLDALYRAIAKSQDDIAHALNRDLSKSPAEAYLTETGIVLSELSLLRKKLKSWMKPRRVRTGLALWPGKSRIHPEPYGLVLVMAPWNYPFHLSLVPLADALAAGNCVTLKPSSRSPATSAVIASILQNALSPEHAAIVQGGPETGQALLRERFDFILYTGSARVGKTVMEAAARRLTPVCLELGGKSPVIVLDDANLETAARRIAFGKTLNAGQTCVAPDYVLVDKSRKDRLVALLRAAFSEFPGPDALNNPDYCRIISPQALDRLDHLAGGQAALDRQSLRMAPLVMDDAGPDDPVMQEEIFGPLLPVLAFSTPEEAEALVRRHERPLAVYIFTDSPARARGLIDRLSFGGGCVNDTVMHVASHHLPFGGVGQSGTGRYHGLAGFELFSNMKSILHKPARPDPSFRYPPYTSRILSLIKKILK